MPSDQWDSKMSPISESVHPRPEPLLHWHNHHIWGSLVPLATVITANPESRTSGPICHHPQADNFVPCCWQYSEVVHLMARAAISVPTESHQGIYSWCHSTFWGASPPTADREEKTPTEFWLHTGRSSPSWRSRSRTNPSLIRTPALRPQRIVRQVQVFRKTKIPW